MFRPLATVALALALGAVAAPQPAPAAHHEPVVQVIAVEVMPGKLEAYRAEVKKLRGVLERLGSSAVVRMWSTSVGGPDTGTVIVALEYPNRDAWAADAPKTQNDSEWQKILAGLDSLRKVESSSVWRDISPNPVQGAAPGSGSVLFLTGVTVERGKLEEYRKRVGSVQGISERLGLKGRARMWHAEVAGPNTGAVAVGTQYPDLATYSSEQAKLAGDAEWQKLLAGLDEVRTITGRWLYREITP
jgi:hypothetical protein